MSNFDSSPPGEVAVVVELLLQFQGLKPCVRLPRPLRPRAQLWKKETKKRERRIH